MERLVAEAAAAGAGCAAALVRAALKRTRLFAGLRELPKYQIVEALAEVRRQLGRSGSGLAAAGRIAAAGRRLLPGLGRSAEGLAGQPLQATSWRERREAYALELDRRHIPRVLLSDGTEPEALQAGVAGTAAGPAGR